MPLTSNKLRWAVLERDKFTCRYCGAAAPEYRMVVDHIIPTVAGGTDDMDNLVTACVPCNSGKLDRLPDGVLGRHAAKWGDACATPLGVAVYAYQMRVSFRAALRQWPIHARPIVSEKTAAYWLAAVHSDDGLKRWVAGLLGDAIAGTDTATLNVARNAQPPLGLAG